MLGVRDVTHVVLAPSERDHALLLKLLQVILSCCAVENGVRMARITKQERDVEEPELRDDTREGRARDEGYIKVSETELLRHLDLAPYSAVWI